MMESTASNNFRVITYNIDGLNPFALSERTSEIIKILLKENVEVLNLQEVVPETFRMINPSLKNAGYCLSIGDNNISRDYFTATFVRRSCFASLNSYSIPFTNNAASQQGRSLLATEIDACGSTILILNAHLESCGTAMKSVGSTKRQEQLKQALKVLQDFNKGPAMLVGDLNIRDAEASAILPTTTNIRDMTDILDQAADKKQRSFKRHTWFMPKSAGQSVSNYKARYDRVYVTTGRDIIPVNLSLIGCEDVIDASFAETIAEFEGGGVVPYLTPSDHRGLLCSFTLRNSPPPPPPSSSLISTMPPVAAIERKRKRGDSDTTTSSPPEALPTETSLKTTLSSSSESESSQEDQATTISTSNRRQLFLDALAKRSIT